jgi:hypothetical protein
MIDLKRKTVPVNNYSLLIEEEKTDKSLTYSIVTDLSKRKSTPIIR